jgi:hypothetical protein
LVFDCGTDALPTALIWDWSAHCRRADYFPKENCLRNSVLMLWCLSRAFPRPKVKLEYVGAPTILECGGSSPLFHPNQASKSHVTG